LETYDEEEDDDALFGVAGLHGLTYYGNNEADPYIVLDAPDDAEEMDDFVIRSTDNLMLVGQTEDDYSHLEVYVYEDQENNFYVHPITFPSPSSRSPRTPA